VVDVKKETMAVDAELHADEEKLLLENGSKQTDLWGINIYPGEKWEKYFYAFAYTARNPLHINKQ